MTEIILQCFHKNLEESKNVNAAITKTLEEYRDALSVLIPEIAEMFLETCLNFAVDDNLPEAFQLMVEAEELNHLKNLLWQAILKIAETKYSHIEVVSRLSDAEVNLMMTKELV
jgi:hypothetical protein